MESLEQLILNTDFVGDEEMLEIILANVELENFFSRIGNFMSVKIFHKEESAIYYNKGVNYLLKNLKNPETR